MVGWAAPGCNPSSVTRDDRHPSPFVTFQLYHSLNRCKVIDLNVKCRLKYSKQWPAGMSDLLGSQRARWFLTSTEVIYVWQFWFKILIILIVNDMQLICASIHYYVAVGHCSEECSLTPFSLYGNTLVVNLTENVGCEFAQNRHIQVQSISSTGSLRIWTKKNHLDLVAKVSFVNLHGDVFWFCFNLI